MALTSIGTAEDQRVYFNYAYLTINSKYAVDIESLSINKSYEMKYINSLNSIKRRASRRSNATQELSMNVKSDNQELKKLFYSSSSTSGTDTIYSIKDGQQDDTSTWTITVYFDDDKTDGKQFTLTNPIIMQMNETNTSQDFWAADMTVSVDDITERESFS